MYRAFDFVALLNASSAEYEHIQPLETHVEPDGDLIVAVQTTFMHTLGWDDATHEVAINELTTSHREMTAMIEIPLTLPIEARAWVSETLVELAHAGDLLSTLSALPLDPETDAETLTLVGTLAFRFPITCVEALVGQSLRLMLNQLCHETVMTAMQLVLAYEDLSKAA